MKIRTDFVTNSSSSSYVAVTVEMRNGNSYDISWDSGNITPDPIGELMITEEQYESFTSGEELMEILNDYTDEVTASWKEESPGYESGGFRGNVDAIRTIEDFSNTVARVTIENSVEVFEPVFDSRENYNYMTGKYSHKVHYIEGPDDDDKFGSSEWGYSEDDEVIYYFEGKTFEDDIYNPSVEQAVISRCSSLSSDELNYVISEVNSDPNCKKIGPDDKGKELYESLARYLAAEEYSLQELHDPETYLSFIEANAEEYRKIVAGREMYDWPEEIVCSGKAFVTTYLSESEQAYVYNYIRSHGGIIKEAVSGKVDYLIVASMDIAAKKRDQAIELKTKKGKDIKIIDLAYFMELIKNGKVKYKVGYMK